MSGLVERWALAQDLDPVPRLTLWAMATAVTDEGRHCFLSVRTLAQKVKVSESTLKRCIHELARLDYIRPGDQQLVSHLRPDRRPKVWDLWITRGVRLSPRPDRAPDPVDNPEDQVLSELITGVQSDLQTQELKNKQLTTTHSRNAQNAKTARETPRSVDSLTPLTAVDPRSLPCPHDAEGWGAANGFTQATCPQCRRDRAKRRPPPRVAHLPYEPLHQHPREADP